MSVLLISLILRWILIFRGGQYYISDETRYEVSRDAARFLFQGQLGEALRQFTLSPEHLGFKVAGILPAVVENVTRPSLVLRALFFSLFSVFNLYLIFLLSRRTTAFPTAPYWALILSASCVSLLYFSRHLFPYDMAMSFGLLALFSALSKHQTARTSIVCGGLSLLCFITYNGYWLLAGFAMLVNVLVREEISIPIVRKAICTATGFLAPLALLVAAMSGSGTDMIQEYRSFATSITQGSFEEGGSLPFAYFWHTEHVMILILAGLSIFAGISSCRYRRKQTGLWLGGFLFILMGLLIPSVYLRLFVVYGRLARQMIPFLVILSAEGLAQLASHSIAGNRITGLFLAAIFLQAGWNYASSYALSYPRDFVAEAQARFPRFEFSAKRLAFGAPVICQNNGYAMENAKYYVTPPEKIPHVEGQVLMSASHPSNFRPYQYEGDPPAVRQAFDLLKLRMRFYKVDEEFMAETNPAWTSIKSCVARKK